MTFRYDNVFINETATVTGPYEGEGPLSEYFDFCYKDLYFGCKSWELAESKLIDEGVLILLDKLGLKRSDVDLFISGDLLNQLTASSYAGASMPCCYIGVYAACATSVLGLIVGSNLVNCGQACKVVCATSSHNNGAEKQFRYPVEYGGPKRKTATFTSTGSALAFVSSDKCGIRVESATLGRVVDSGICDVYNMGAVMALAASDTLYNHLNDTKRDFDYYDLILTGDLGIYGKEIFKDVMMEDYGISLNNYNDTGVMLYDLSSQPVYAGASGPACAPLVVYGYIFDQMKKGKLKRVLLVATGALMSQSLVNQKQTIPAIAHAISLEAI